MSNYNNYLNMKKLAFTALVIFLSIGAYAQFEQGTIMVGGNFSADFNTLKSKNGSTTSTIGKQTDISFGPTAGYFIIDNLAAGLGLGITSSSFKADGTSYKISS